MFSTREVIALLREENPHKQVTEDQIRRALRTEVVPYPTMIAGRYGWMPDQVHQLAEALGLHSPFSQNHESLTTNTDSSPQM